MADTTPAPTAAQTVKQAANAFAGGYAGKLADSHNPPEVWHALGNAAYKGFEAGAAWMRERVLEAAPCASVQCGLPIALHTLPEVNHNHVRPWWLTALCASDAEKEQP